jgi:hypothetical protein
MRYIKKQQTPPKFTEWKAQANEAWQPFWNSKSTNPHSVHKKRTKKIRKVIMTKDNTDK